METFKDYENIRDYCTKHRRLRKIMFGLLVITAGALLLGFNMGFLPETYKHVVFSWQMLLIAIGLINIVTRHSWGFGIILIAVGGFFMAPLIHVFPFDFISLFWPILLIFAGIMIIIKRGFGHHRWNHMHHMRKMRHMHHMGHWQHNAGQSTLEEGYINVDHVFSGSKRKFTDQEFKGGKIDVVFGGIELDLTHTTLAVGKNELIIDCVFGGVNLLVPSDWNIHIDVNTVMGGFIDKRNVIKNEANNGRELYIKGSAVFGGGEIKSY